MFQDTLHSPEEVAEMHRGYAQIAAVIEEALKSYVWALEEVHKAFFQDGKDIHTVPTLLLMDFAEAIDGVVILAHKGSAKNCGQLLRTALEIQLGAEYMMEDKATYEQRSLAYEFFHLKEKLAYALLCDSKSDAGKRFRVEAKGHLLMEMFDELSVDYVNNEIQSYQNRINSNRYAAIRTKLAEMKKSNKRRDKWYSLSGGPGNCKCLAYHLKRGPMYEIFYSSWSSVSHGASALNRITPKAQGMVEMSALRCPKGLPNVCALACALTNHMTRFIVDGLVPRLRPEMVNRYVQKIKPGLEFARSVRGL